MHSIHCSTRSTNEDHVLAADRSDRGRKSSHAKRFVSLYRQMDRETDREIYMGRYSCKDSGGKSTQQSQSVQEAKRMLGTVFLLPPHLNIESQLCDAVCFDTLNICIRGKELIHPI